MYSSVDQYVNSYGFEMCDLTASELAKTQKEFAALQSGEQVPQSVLCSKSMKETPQTACSYKTLRGYVGSHGYKMSDLSPDELEDVKEEFVSLHRGNFVDDGALLAKSMKMDI